MCSNKCIVELLELEYVVLKVNGSDISHLSKYEAVQMFLQAKETLVVELKKASDSNIPTDIDDNDVLTSNSNKEEQQQQQLSAKLENLNLSNARTTSSASPKVNSNSLMTSPIKNQVIVTLRAFSADPIIASPAKKPSIATKETQTVENIFELNHARTEHDIVRIADHFIEQEHHLFEQCLEPEIDIEEITLSKGDVPSDQIGLSVCCNGFFSNSEGSAKSVGNNNSNIGLISNKGDACVDVFISDIHPESIAERDGRLRRGDQILRINGKDIKSKEEAESQIAENSMAVTLLVSRILYPDDEDDDDEEYYVDSNFEYANSFLTDDYTNVVDKLDKVLMAQAQSMKPAATNESSNQIESVKSIDLAQSSAQTTESNNSHIKSQTNSTLMEKCNVDPPRILSTHNKPSLDTHLGQEKTLKLSKGKSLPTTHSAASAKAKNYEYDESEHIYETIPEDSESEPLYCSPYQSSTYMTAMGSCSSATMAETLEMQQQSQRVAQWLGIKSQARTVQTLGARPTSQHKQRNSSNRVSTLRSALTNTSGSSSSGAGCSACGPANVDSENLNEELDNSSSAYNTGGSNNSASPLAFALNKSQNILTQDNDNVTPCSKNPIMSSSYQSKVQPLQSPKEPLVTSPLSSMLAFGKSAGMGLCSSNFQPCGLSESTIQVKTDDSIAARMRLKQTEEQPSHCPQFNAPNLSRYHFVSSQEVAIANKSQIPSVSNRNSILVKTKNGHEEIPMVWKVKRRPDGTRYIVKRPVRNRLPVVIRKNIRNNEVTTTEDDTISEVKIGRYWTKEERKRHIEKARERRQQQQFPIQ
ncbi:slo-interacting protein 1-like isoform X3 [Scaptodrosophila lebanonensis]|uniref:Slo-interacting protein 1-like isoform X3 n=1 Tax=Drosophila lebanonensis TaxID=7225 RepID=A0A6J2TW56_DROLE|nr:slo-interacting protein 1-like isoform X3 [Scaptodrosophila lebanonensis]